VVATVLLATMSGAAGAPVAHDHVAAVGTGLGGSRSFMDLEGVAGLPTLSDGKLTRRTYVLGYKALGSLSRLQLVFVNQHFSSFREAPGPNTIFVAATIEYPIGTRTTRPTFYRVRSKGSTEWAVAPGGLVMTDPTAGVRIPTGAEYRVRVLVRVARAGEKWPLARPAMVGSAGSPLAPTRAEGTYDGDLLTTNRGWVPASTAPYAPQAILAPTNKPSVAIFGDSIAHGYDGTAAGGGYYGGIVDALDRRAGYVSIATDSETAENFAKPSFRRLRMASVTGVKYAVVLIGRNDLSANTRSVAQMQADLLTIWRSFTARGVKVYACTILPRTTSTDQWKTTRKQTVHPSEAKRVALNEWIRAGAPIDRATGTAVSGHPDGALTAGSSGHPLTGHFDTADTVETARNSGIWKVDGTPHRFTDGGVHPTAAGYALMAAAIDPAVLTAPPPGPSSSGGGSGLLIALLIALVVIGVAVLLRQLVRALRP
jgi:lysophospholipase L1-like esterase